MDTRDTTQAQATPSHPYLTALGLRLWQADSERWYWELGEQFSNHGYDSEEQAIQDALDSYLAEGFMRHRQTRR